MQVCAVTKTINGVSRNFVLPVQAFSVNVVDVTFGAPPSTASQYSQTRTLYESGHRGGAAFAL